MASDCQELKGLLTYLSCSNSHLALMFTIFFVVVAIVIIINVTDHFSGLGTAVGLMCVCVSGK